MFYKLAFDAGLRLVALATACIKYFFIFQGRLAFCSCCWRAIFLNIVFDASTRFALDTSSSGGPL
jgi:hypothetical protein